MWRGGRAFKTEAERQQEAQEQEEEQRQQEQQQQQRQQSSDQDNSVMIIDSDDEETENQNKESEPTAAASKPDHQDSTYIPPTFAEIEDEIDPREPYEQILRHIDIHTGVKVVSISIPPTVTQEEYDVTLDACPPIFSKMILVAAICADSTVRLFSLPLAPPMPDTTSEQEMGIQRVIIPDGAVQNVPAGVALTLTSHREVEGDRAEDGQSTAKQWDVLLAVHSTQFGGLLSVFRVPIIAPSTVQDAGLFRFSQTGTRLIQKQYLCRPVKTIAFNPITYPKRQHGRILVAHDDKVKVFQSLTPSPDEPLYRKSTTDTGVIKLLDEDGNEVTSATCDFEDQGKWLFTLHLSRTKPPSRKIIDAKWVFGGKGIMVLLTDGTWGVWCIERFNSSDKNGSQVLDLSNFALSGRITATAPVISTAGGATSTATRNQHQQSPAPAHPTSSDSFRGATLKLHPQPRQSQQQEQPQMRQFSSVPGFTPMTPSTRKTREGTLFQASTTTSLPKEDEIAPEETVPIQDSNSQGQQIGQSGEIPGIAFSRHVGKTILPGQYSSLSAQAPRTHGGIAIYSLPSLESEVPDEEILIWHAGTTVRIPVLTRLLEEVKGNNKMGSATNSASIVPVYLQNQLQTGAGLLPPTSFRRLIDADAPPEVIVATEYELIILPAVIDEEAEDEAIQAREALIKRNDQERLRKGDLDLDGINRVVADMQKRNEQQRQGWPGVFSGGNIPAASSAGKGVFA